MILLTEFAAFIVSGNALDPYLPFLSPDFCYTCIPYGAVFFKYGVHQRFVEVIDIGPLLVGLTTELRALLFTPAVGHGQHKRDVTTTVRQLDLV